MNQHGYVGSNVSNMHWQNTSQLGRMLDANNSNHTWGYGNALVGPAFRGLVGMEALLPFGYTRQEYEEERQLAAKSLLRGPSIAAAGLAATTAVGYGLFGHPGRFLLQTFPSLSGGSVASTIARVGALKETLMAGSATFGKAVFGGIGRAAGGAAGGASGVGVKLGASVFGAVGSRLITPILGEAAASAFAAGVSSFGTKAIAGAAGIGTVAGGTLGSLAGVLAHPGMLIAGAAIEATAKYGYRAYQNHQTEIEIEKEMMAKSDRILSGAPMDHARGGAVGFSSAQRARLINSIKGMAMSTASTGDLFGMGSASAFGGHGRYTERLSELKAMLSVGTDMGMFDMSRSFDDFEKKFRETVKVVDKMSKMIQKSKGEVMALVSQVQQNEGQFDLGRIGSNIARKDFISSTTGASLGTIMMEGQFGATAARQMGHSPELGSRIAADSRLFMSRAKREGIIDRGVMFRMGGEQGIISTITQNTLSLFSDPAMLEELATWYGEGGTFSTDRMDKFLYGSDQEVRTLSEDRKTRMSLRSLNTQSGKVEAGGLLRANIQRHVLRDIKSGKITSDMMRAVMMGMARDKNIKNRRAGLDETLNESLTKILINYGADAEGAQLTAGAFLGELDHLSFGENRIYRAGMRDKEVETFKESLGWVGRAAASLSPFGFGRATARTKHGYSDDIYRRYLIGDTLVDSQLRIDPDIVMSSIQGRIQGESIMPSGYTEAMTTVEAIRLGQAESLRGAAEIDTKGTFLNSLLTRAYATDPNSLRRDGMMGLLEATEVDANRAAVKNILLLKGSLAKKLGGSSDGHIDASKYQSPRTASGLSRMISDLDIVRQRIEDDLGITVEDSGLSVHAGNEEVLARIVGGKFGSGRDRAIAGLTKLLSGRAGDPGTSTYKALEARSATRTADTYAQHVMLDVMRYGAGFGVVDVEKHGRGGTSFHMLKMLQELKTGDLKALEAFAWGVESGTLPSDGGSILYEGSEYDLANISEILTGLRKTAGGSKQGGTLAAFAAEGLGILQGSVDPKDSKLGSLKRAIRSIGLVHKHAASSDIIRLREILALGGGANIIGGNEDAYKVLSAIASESGRVIDVFGELSKDKGFDEVRLKSLMSSFGASRLGIDMDKFGEMVKAGSVSSELAKAMAATVSKVSYGSGPADSDVSSDPEVNAALRARGEGLGMSQEVMDTYLKSCLILKEVTNRLLGAH